MATFYQPNGSYTSLELPPSGVPGVSGGFYQTGVTPRRGTAIWFHGLSNVFSNPISPTPVLTNDFVFFLQSFFNMLNYQLAQDGWNILNISYPEDGAQYIQPNQTGPAAALLNSIAADSGCGAQYLGDFLRTVEGALDWCDRYSITNTQAPKLLYGFSHGGWGVIKAAQAFASRIAGAAAISPATVWETVNPVWGGLGLSGVANLPFWNANWQYMDATATDLNAATCPTIVQYGTTDTSVGYSGHGAATDPSMAGTAGSSFAGSGTLVITGVSAQNFKAGVLVRVLGDHGYMFFQFTGATGSTQLTGGTLVAGTGNFTSGGDVEQSTTDAMITNALAAGANISRNPTTNAHEFKMADSGTYYNVTGPTNLSSFTGSQPLTFFNNTTQAPGFVSGKCAVRSDQGNWHTITFTGSVTATTLPNVVVASPGAETISQFAPLMAIPVSGSPQSIPYWVFQNVDPNCPKAY